MANISTISSIDENKSKICRIKSIKGFLRHKNNEKFPDIDLTTLVPEISNNVYLDFVVRYLWYGENGNDCYLEIGWELAYLNDGEAKKYPPPSQNNEDPNDMLSEYLKADNICQLEINGFPINIDDLQVGLDGKKTLNSYSMQIFDTEEIFHPAWIGVIAGVDPSVKNIEITFNYNYAKQIGETEEETVSIYIDLGNSNTVKIPRPSKYEKNVVFNQAGLNEMIDYFKKYPVIDLKQSEKYGHVKLFYGDSKKSEEGKIHIAPRGFELSTEDSLLCDTNLLPSINNKYTLGSLGQDISYTSALTYYAYHDNQFYSLEYNKPEGRFEENNNKNTVITVPVGSNSNYPKQYGIYLPDSLTSNLEIFKLIPPSTANSLSAFVSTDLSICSCDPETSIINFNIEQIEYNKTYSISIYWRDPAIQSTFKFGGARISVTFYHANDLIQTLPHQRWKSLYLSDTLQSRNGIINDALNVEGLLTAKQIAGQFVGTDEGESININDNFIVNANGDVELKGDITWGSNPIKALYHKGIGENREAPAAPSFKVNIKPSDEGTNRDWHSVYDDKEDRWMSMTFNDGKTWNTPMRVTAVDGEPGPAGGWTNENIATALQLVDVDGFFNFHSENNGIPVNKVGVKASVILSQLLKTNKIIMDPGVSYDSKNPSSFSGGYIAFSIPSPLSYTPRKIKRDDTGVPQKVTTNGQEAYTFETGGWQARFGFMRGNGDGANPTNGIGIMIETEATLSDIHPDLFQPADNGSKSTKAEKLHLVLAQLMLTQSGLGLMTAANIGTTVDSARNWCTLDNINSDYPPHYVYRWWRGDNDARNIKRTWRLWLHEDNGGLYYVDKDKKEIVAWNWQEIK